MKSIVLALRKALAYCDETPTSNELIIHEIQGETCERSVFKLKWGETVAFEFEVMIDNAENSVVACVLYRRRFTRVRMSAIMEALMNAINGSPLDMPALEGHNEVIAAASDDEDHPVG